MSRLNQSINVYDQVSTHPSHQILIYLCWIGSYLFVLFKPDPGGCKCLLHVFIISNIDEVCNSNKKSPQQLRNSNNDKQTISSKTKQLVGAVLYLLDCAHQIWNSKKDKHCILQNVLLLHTRSVFLAIFIVIYLALVYNSLKTCGDRSINLNL